MLLTLHPAEIRTPGTPGVSHGTKKILSNFFLYHKNQMLFYAFWGFVLQKMPKNGINRPFSALLAITMEFGKNGRAGIIQKGCKFVHFRR